MTLTLKQAIAVARTSMFATGKIALDKRRHIAVANDPSPDAFQMAAAYNRLAEFAGKLTEIGESLE